MTHPMMSGQWCWGRPPQEISSSIEGSICKLNLQLWGHLPTLQDYGYNRGFSVAGNGTKQMASTALSRGASRPCSKFAETGKWYKLFKGRLTLSDPRKHAPLPLVALSSTAEDYSEHWRLSNLTSPQEMAYCTRNAPVNVDVILQLDTTGFEDSKLLMFVTELEIRAPTSG